MMGNIFSVLTAILSLLAFVICQPVMAAEIQCADTYAHAAPPDSSAWKELYPSGRRPTKSSCMAILINGDIESGDGDRFLKVMRGDYPFIVSVYLASSGGSVDEAIKIGRLIRKYMITTYAPWGFSDDLHNGGYLFGEPENVCPGDNCHCASACYLIWAAGAERKGDMIGIHRPSIHSHTFASLPPDKASIIYKQQLTEINQYLLDMEVPQKYIDIMTDTSSKSIYWLKLEEAKSLQERPPSVEELLSASCPILSRDETHIMLAIQNAYRLRQPVSEQDDALLKKLSKIDSESTSCVIKKLSNYRDSVAFAE